MRLADLIAKLLRRPAKRLRPPAHPRFKPEQATEAGPQFVIGGVPTRRIERPKSPRFCEVSPAEYGGGVVIGGQPPGRQDKATR